MTDLSTIIATATIALCILSLAINRKTNAMMNRSREEREFFRDLELNKVKDDEGVIWIGRKRNTLLLEHGHWQKKTWEEIDELRAAGRKLHVVGLRDEWRP